MVDSVDFQLWQPEDVAKGLSEKMKALRLFRGWKQDTLAGRSGVTLASLRRFEQTGRISLRALLRLAFALNCLDEFTTILNLPEAHSLAELEKKDRQEKPKRGRK